MEDRKSVIMMKTGAWQYVLRLIADKRYIYYLTAEKETGNIVYKIE